MTSGSGTQDKLTAALDVQKTRFAADYPALLAAAEGYRAANDGVVQAGARIAQVLKSMGEMYPSNSYGIAFNKLSQGQAQLGEHRATFVSKALGDKFLKPLGAALDAERKAFAAQDKEIRTTMTQYGQEIKKMMSNAQKEQKKGTDAMLSALSLVNNKVQEFDNKNQNLLESLEKKEQERFVTWFQKWATVMDSQLKFHQASAKKLRELEQVWQEAVGAKNAASTSAADSIQGAPAAESEKASSSEKGDESAAADDSAAATDDSEAKGAKKKKEKAPKKAKKEKKK